MFKLHLVCSGNSNYFLRHTAVQKEPTPMSVKLRASVEKVPILILIVSVVSYYACSDKKTEKAYKNKLQLDMTLYIITIINTLFTVLPLDLRQHTHHYHHYHHYRQNYERIRNL